MMSRNRRSKSAAAVVKDDKNESDQQATTTTTTTTQQQQQQHHPQQQQEQQQHFDGSDADEMMRIPDIFAAPTVDTLDDQSLFVSNGRHRARGPLASAKSQTRSTTTTPSSTIALGEARTNGNGNANMNTNNRDDMKGTTRHVVSFTPNVVTGGHGNSKGNGNSNSNGNGNGNGNSSIDPNFTFDDTHTHSHYSYHHSTHSPSNKKSNNGIMKPFADFDSPQARATQAQTGMYSLFTAKQSTASSTASASTAAPAIATAAAQQPRRKRKTPQKPRDFQNSEDAATVTLRPVNVAQRSAFDTHRVASLEKWHLTASNLMSQSNTNNNSSSNPSSSSSAQKKLSPSLQHLKLLHALQSATTIRQLAFSPSVGIHSDAFVPWWEDALTATTPTTTTPATTDDDTTNGDNESDKAKSLKRRVSSAALEQRDGRYRSIHPVQATLSALPTVPPALSNKKARLPLRSDVGFPNAAVEEVIQKQAEIQQETEWEEASPRIIVLVTSDDLGTAVPEDESASSMMVSPEHWEWNGGGLQSMPFAGKDLLRAKELNALHFSKKSSLLSKALLQAGETKTNNSSYNNSNNGMDSFKKKLLEPNRTSMLAPPLDSSFSKTLGWRPRPFHDRPPGMEYLLCWPLDIAFDVGNIEPLLCSLALYNLPAGSTNSSNNSNNSGISIFGKISEEFWFPAGDWDGKMEIDPSFLSIPGATKSSGNNYNNNSMAPSEEDVLDSWSRRNQKAIFSYDPLAIRGGEESLFWVLQVYKVANEDAIDVYLQVKNGSKANRRSNNVKKLFTGKLPSKPTPSQESIEDEKSNANQFFDKFGTKAMRTLAYGVKPVTPRLSSGSDSVEYDKLEFPKGAVQDVALMASPENPESQEAFVHRLSKVSLSLSNNGKVNDPDHLRSKASEHGVSAGSSLVRSEVSLLASEGSAAFDMASVGSFASDPSLPKSSSSVLASSVSDSTQSKTPDASKQGLSSAKQKKKKNIVKRMWVSPKKVPASRPVKGSSSSTPSQNVLPSSTLQKRYPKGQENANEDLDPHLSATTKIFSTTLSTDWLQSMLLEPTDRDGFKILPQPLSTTNKNSLPKLLCDISGDYAVMLEDRGSRKKSALARLPSHKRAAGYIGTSEIREMMFLPARPEKQYDLDMPPSYRSHVNLLYLYPRLLRPSSEQQGSDCKQKKHETRARYTVRFRLVRSSLDVEGNKVASSNTPLEAFHSSCPWVGSPLSKEVYTTVCGGQPPVRYNKSGKQDAKDEQHMKDEFKLRLPEILDGTFSLQFTLYEIASDNSTGVTLCAVGESSIPLSSSLNRDAATVIPNGCHRLKLGDFRLYVESRLVSSVHIGDAAVAAAVRDFPDSLFADGGGPPTRAVLSRFSPRESPVPSEAGMSYPSLFANSSDGSLVGCFQLLLYSHLSNLTNAATNDSGRGDFMMGNLVSLFVLVRKVKKRLDPARIKVLFKTVLDEFDEGFLLPKNHSGKVDDEVASGLGGSEVELAQVVTGSMNVEGNAIDDSNDNMAADLHDEGAVRVRHKDSLRDGIQKRLNRRKSAGIGSGDSASLSRVAYGASKTDRLKIEAELYYDGARLAHLYDDDETMVTSGTTLQNITDLKQKQRAAAVLERQKNGHDFYSDGTIQAATAAASRAIQHQNQDASATKPEEDDGFATRVKTVANVMLAPCVGNQGPLGSSPRRLSLDCGRSKRRSSKMGSTSGNAPVPEPEESAPKTNKETFVLPGSDDEDEQAEAQKSRYSTFRGLCEDNILTFSIQGGWPNQNGSSLLVSGGNCYLYESLIFCWVNAWSDYKSEAAGANDVPLFESSTAANSKLLDFFLNMDILLPLCLKSLAVRYCIEVQASSDLLARAVLDPQHMTILKHFVQVLARCVMGQALTHSNSGDVLNEKNAALLRALASSELIVEWFEGLTAILHPEVMRSLIGGYFQTLNECETAHSKENPKGVLEFQWNEENIHRVRSSRQLRLRAVEKLAVMPSFLALNFPNKFSDASQSADNSDSGISSWKVQYGDISQDGASQEQPHRTDRHTSSGDDRRPKSGWLAQILADEALSVCALSCEAVVAEAMAQVELSNDKSHQKTDKKSQSFQLERRDLLMFQSLAIHAVTCFYELVLRRNAMDRRFQTNACRGRIAALYAECLLTQSLKSVRWLARMESSHKVRSLWMLCLLYVLQEAPEVLLRNLVKSYCDPNDFLVIRFIRLLRLASSTFQSFIDQPRHSTFPNEIDEGISPWLLQESFNTICATGNIVVEECVKLTESNPKEQRKMIQAVLDLFLHVLTTPQSAVTHLRAVGGAIFALEKFGLQLFLDVVGKNLQHWIRVVLGLMNSTSLSVRSISVDFVVSLVGGAFDLLGSVDDIILVFVSVLPEVAAREIGLFSVDGHIKDGSEDLERCLWPLRRSFADLEDANPLDDDRIDPELSPVFKTLCRVSQAVLDSVLIELRLRKEKCVIVGTRVNVAPLDTRTFDADEESLFEAADFFLPEIAPMQRLRWLLTLKKLHEAKGQWAEAAECLITCANTISDAIPHLKYVWRPTRFSLWSDARRSTWLTTVGEEMGHPDRGNKAVMAFADEFLEPARMLHAHEARATTGTLQQPTVAAMCKMLSNVANEAVQLYLLEEGMDEVAYARLEGLLQIVMNILCGYGSLGLNRGRSIRAMNSSMRKQHIEEEAALRRVVAALSGDITKLAEKLLLLAQERDTNNEMKLSEKDLSKRPFYVLIEISGTKPPRFQESTTLPTFMDWSMPCVCRVPQQVVDTAHKIAKGGSHALNECICVEYGKPLKLALASEKSPDSIILCHDLQSTSSGIRDPSKTFIDITILEADTDLPDSMPFPLESRRFFYQKNTANADPRDDNGKLVIATPAKFMKTMIEVTVANTFPLPLSRQCTLLTSKSASSNFGVP